ncbi:hypothetical protein CK203_049464 [Vitis vinifera]|uniref:Uncharacterized protein n=1 Tax=Vitis vinifera TaxID=29760 RepID=A0A438HAY7_VITVI|nr:hypothetical protein CK203_049464 [Vitis vinifera]
MIEEAHASSISSSLAWEEPIKNASEILDVLRQVKRTQCYKASLPNRANECYNPMQVLQSNTRSGCPTISVNIGGNPSGEGIADLGASVNLLPYSVYKELGINYVPIILGRPFLATSNAIINCRNGVMPTHFQEYDIGTQHLPSIILDQFEENPDESHEDLNDGLAEPMGMNVVMSNWRQKPVILPLFKDEEEMKEAKDAILKLELKTLPA